MTQEIDTYLYSYFNLLSNGRKSMLKWVKSEVDFHRIMGINNELLVIYNA